MQTWAIMRAMMRHLTRWIALGSLAAIAMGPTVAAAQVKCYIRKCYLYPDGSQICERTPVDCDSLPPVT
jgi:hypothetical protein